MKARINRGEEAKTITIVEDERSQARSMQLILEGSGYKTVLARNAEECLTKLRRIRPHLILLDIIMPKDYGAELLERLKKDPGYRSIPVVVTTIVSPLSGVKEDVERIDPQTGFLEKPFSKDELLEKVRQYLGQ